MEYYVWALIVMVITLSSISSDQSDTIKKQKECIAELSQAYQDHDFSDDNLISNYCDFDH